MHQFETFSAALTALPGISPRLLDKLGAGRETLSVTVALVLQRWRLAKA